MWKFRQDVRLYDSKNKVCEWNIFSLIEAFGANTA